MDQMKMSENLRKLKKENGFMSLCAKLISFICIYTKIYIEENICRNF